VKVTILLIGSSESHSCPLGRRMCNGRGHPQYCSGQVTSREGRAWPLPSWGGERSQGTARQSKDSTGVRSTVRKAARATPRHGSVYSMQAG